MAAERIDLPQSTLDLLTFKTPALGTQQEWVFPNESSKRSAGFTVSGLHRLERPSRIRADWGASENSRCAKYYQLTRSGRKQCDDETAARREPAFAISQAIERR